MVIKKVVAVFVVAICLQLVYSEPIPKKQEAEDDGLDSWDRSDWHDSWDLSDLYGTDRRDSSVKGSSWRCSHKWCRFGGSEYLACTGGERNIDAKNICRRYKAQLVEISSKAEFDAVTRSYRRLTRKGDTIWTSACKRSGRFFWPGGRVLSLTDRLWCSGEPDDLGDPTENGVVIEHEGGRWCYSVEKQTDYADFVCERKVN